MSEARTVSAEVEVAVDPATAFSAFTGEMNLWWVRGPINFFDAARAVAVTCESGVGGRLLEVYDETAGDSLELGRITVWQPGERLAWQSSVDDVAIDVRFDPTEGGTMVRVLASIPAGGQDRGGTMWLRVVPPWFGAWCARRDAAPREPADLGRLGVAVSYAKPATAARWLASVFGFETPGVLPDDDAGRHWIEFRVGNCSLIIERQDGARQDGARQDGGASTHVTWVFVDDLDSHFARAQAGGATIVEPVRQHGYRSYVADDLEGNRWRFAQARPTMR
jgi:uncharacterized glyoxalase superfamily protein PhnB